MGKEWRFARTMLLEWVASGPDRHDLELYERRGREDPEQRLNEEEPPGARIQIPLGTSKAASVSKRFSYIAQKTNFSQLRHSSMSSLDPWNLGAGEGSSGDDYYLRIGSHAGGFSLPLYLDRHELDGVSAADVAAAHELDLNVQDKHDVRYLSYWFDYQRQQAFCLVDAPSPDAAERVHRESHGLIPMNIIEVQQDQVEEFLGAPPHFPSGEAYESPAFRTILFTDIVDSTALTQRLGDAAAMTVLRQHDDAVRDGLRELGGHEIKHTGDGIMASFTSASRGVECALAIQERFGELATSDVDSSIQVRIGISAGEPVSEKGDLFGTAVQLAARLCASADPGGILVSHAVRELCAGKALEFDAARDLELRGFAEIVRAYATLPKRGAARRLNR